MSNLPETELIDKKKPVINGDLDLKYFKNYVKNINLSHIAFPIKLNNNVNDNVNSIALKAKFGKDVSEKTKSSVNNVDVLIDGQIKLDKISNNKFELKRKIS